MIGSDLIDPLLQTASWASNPDNAQPFVFEFREDVLIIDVDPKRARHILNPKNDSIRVSFGFWLEYFRQAAAAKGLSVKLEGFQGPPFRVRIEPGKIDLPFRFSTEILRNRRVHRWPYDRLDWSPQEMQKFSHEMQKVPANLLWRDHAQFSKICSEIARTDRCLFDHRELFKDTIQWLYLSRSTYEKHRDGFYYPEAGAFFLMGSF